MKGTEPSGDDNGGVLARNPTNPDPMGGGAADPDRVALLGVVIEALGIGVLLPDGGTTVRVRPPALAG
ncbi:MAG: hypothetical protein HYR62_05145 [Actinobacteria bacterium]|nr:hypothetical protein [Actinomycetota bacterium]